MPETTKNPQRSSLRGFIGIQLDKKTQEYLNKLTTLIKREQNTKLFANVRWTALENRHITLCFLGQIPTEIIPALKTGLTSIAQGTTELETNLFKLGTFPGNSSQLIAAELAATEQLLTLQLSVKYLIESLSISTESSSYRPHITLCRSKRKFQGFSPIELDHPLTLNNITLYQSRPSPIGSSYTALQTVPLQPQ
ncbi:RNA 2',3'-cyclic phosphodiesterase [Microbulbifer sp. A4B17]|uniref:RNA 2',3'-cyclic phosphodiesterase n=1 Tax=Microbulbifer sp. A4B17 TaxID=359370 RepID=UPI000D52DEF4|nr:RNA 2',3'-cyclic phosphodiesterase [Microbulbifer sp. A4B17]AWF80818.1 RNA 2',3'-cyclic phosphodiesterase [Microbulbifer sp. A4B17]